jgi:tetratricopeptide (TPR) repeat protein
VYANERRIIRERIARLIVRRQAQGPPQPVVPGWAVIIGIDNYAKFPRLDCCVADAIAMYVLLTEARLGGFNPAQTRLLLDPKLDDQRLGEMFPGVVESLSSRYKFVAREGILQEILNHRRPATIGSIFREVKRAAGVCLKDGQLLVHFSGHGWVSDGIAYLLPPDAQYDTHEQTSISLKSLVGMMRASPAAQRILIADACYTSAERLAERDLPHHVAILASSMHLAYEDNGHGLLTGNLLDALALKAPMANPAYLTLKDAYDYVFPRVTQWVARNVPDDPFQTPILRAQDASQIVLSGDRSQAPLVSPSIAPPVRPRRTRRVLLLSGLTVCVAIAVVWLAFISSSFNRGKDIYIAPLPLKMLGDSQSLRHLALGINEFLYASLFEWDNVHMPSELSLERAANLPLPKAAGDLGVSLVLRGTFQAEGDRIRLTFNLEDVPGKKTIWSRQFEGSQKALFRLEDEVSNALIEKLRPAGHRTETRAHRAKSVEANDLYLKGKQALRGQQTEAQVLEAIGYYRDALKLDSDFALARARLADACLVMHWQYQKNDRSWLDEAHLAAQQAVQSAEDLPEAHFAMANVDTELGQSEAAFKEWQRALQLAPNSDEGYRGFGRACQANFQKEEAIQAFQKAVEINPYYWNNHFQLAGAYSRFGEYENALCSYTEVADRVPERWEGYAGQAKAYLELGEFEKSIVKAQKALSVQRRPEVLSNLGTAYFYLVDYPGARKAWEDAVAIGRKDQLPLGNLADAYRALQQPQAAAALYAKAKQSTYEVLQQNPRSAEALASLALYLAKTNSVQLGVAKMDEALALEPGKPDLLYSQAVVLAIAQQDARALAALRKAFELGLPVRRSKTEPDFQALRAKPEFVTLVNQFDKPRKPLACEK